MVGPEEVGGGQGGPTRREPLAGSGAGERTGQRCTVACTFESGRDPVKTAGPGHRPNRQVRHRRRITVFRPVTVQPLTFPDRELEPVRYAAVHVNCPKW